MTGDERADRLLNRWADEQEGTMDVLCAPRSLHQIRERLVRIAREACRCDASVHDNALHDMAQDDMPALLRLVDRLSAQLDRVEHLADFYERCGGEATMAAARDIRKALRGAA